MTDNKKVNEIKNWHQSYISSFKNIISEILARL